MRIAVWVVPIALLLLAAAAVAMIVLRSASLLQGAGAVYMVFFVVGVLGP